MLTSEYCNNSPENYSVQIYVMIYVISKFMKNEMFGSNNTKEKPGLSPAFLEFKKCDLLILFDEI